MKLIDIEKLDHLTLQAQGSSRKRKHYCFHQDDQDSMQRMLNAFEPNTYVRPHRHDKSGKREVFVILRGRLLVVFFNDEGQIINHVILDSKKGSYAVEIAGNEWHTATGLELGTVVYEIKDGPYIQSEDKTFATWAPEEDSLQCIDYVHGWLKELGILL